MKTYPMGPAMGMDVNLFAPDGEPWCRFVRGPIVCINGARCIAHNAVRQIISALVWWPS